MLNDITSPDDLLILCNEYNCTVRQGRHLVVCASWTALTESVVQSHVIECQTWQQLLQSLPTLQKHACNCPRDRFLGVLLIQRVIGHMIRVWLST